MQKEAVNLIGKYVLLKLDSLSSQCGGHLDRL
jgi:hypothetical protein